MPDEERVFGEAFRVLRPDGRLAISDVVLTVDVPEELRGDPESPTGRVPGAATIGELETMLESAGFETMRIEGRKPTAEATREERGA